MPMPLPKRLGSDTSLLSDASRITVPPQLVPCLQKVGTEDWIDINDIGDDLADECRESSLLRECSYNLLHKPGFNFFMGFVILFNLVAMIIETDQLAVEEDNSADGARWTMIFGWVVLCIFVLELSVRLLVFQCRFWSDSWNIFDFAVVTIDLSCSLIGLTAGSRFPASILRIFRLAKLARAFKVLRVFPELRLLLASLISSMSAIFWGAVLLLFCMLVWALVAVLFIHPLNKNIDYSGCERCPRAYSSVMQATLTFFQQIITGDRWGEATIPLIEKHPSTAIFFILVFSSVGMAVANLILGVVVSVAQQAQDALREEGKAEKAIFKLEQHTHLLQICKQMDLDKDGLLSQDDVYAAFDQPGEFRDRVLALDLTQEEFDIVWQVTDNEQKGFVSYKEFVSRLSTLKLSETQFMLAYMKYYMTQLRNTLLTKIEVQHVEAMVMEHKVEEEICQLEHKVEEGICQLEHRVEGEIGHRESADEEEAAKMEEKEDAIYRQLLEKPDAVLEASEVQQDIQEQAAGSNAKASSPAPPLITPSRPEQQQVPLMARTSSKDVKEDSSTSAKDQPRLDKDMQNWLAQIRHDIATLHHELKGQLMDMHRKLSPRVHVSTAAASTQDKASSSAQPDLLVLPSKENYEVAKVPKVADELQLRPPTAGS